MSTCLVSSISFRNRDRSGAKFLESTNVATGMHTTQSGTKFNLHSIHNVQFYYTWENPGWLVFGSKILQCHFKRRIAKNDRRRWHKFMQVRKHSMSIFKQQLILKCTKKRFKQYRKARNVTHTFFIPWILG